METIIDFLAVGSTILLYTLGFGFQIRQNMHEPANTEGIHPLIYGLGAFSLLTLTAHSLIHENWILFWAIVMGDLFGSVLLFQFFQYRWRKRKPEACETPMYLHRRRRTRFFRSKSS